MPNLPPPRKSFCHHLSLFPYPLKLRKSHPQQLTANRPWVGMRQNSAPFANRETEERLHLSRLSCKATPSPPFWPLWDYIKASPTTIPKLCHLQRPPGPLERLQAMNALFPSLDDLKHSVTSVLQTNPYTEFDSQTTPTQQYCSLLALKIHYNRQKLIRKGCQSVIYSVLQLRTIQSLHCYYLRKIRVTTYHY
jgi:hypothetical protein